MNERDDKYDSHDEGEYHFSDEHATYEVDTETARVGNVAAAKESKLAGLSRSRRAIIALVVFFSLMFVVYKMLVPASSTPPITTDVAVANKPKVTPPPVKPVELPQASPVIAAAPAPVQQAPAAPAQMQQAAMPGMVPGEAIQTAVPQPSENAPDRLAAIEQQNTKLVNEYQQKMADVETQTTATQTKLQELSTRVAGMEAALTQITQLLQNSNKQQQSVVVTSPSRASKSDAKQMYTVQAIIPGRAWLKSDAGDTVTVAEGDLLRDYGRVTKIDPYDGVVDIDTGNKVVSLSYGASGD